MSKTEELAAKYATIERSDGEGGIDITSYVAFIDGYEQAEKDNALAWEDVCAILYIEREVLREKSNTDADNEDICKEVLKRFLEQKERSKL